MGLRHYIEEVGNLLVDGKCREAYEILRDHYPDLYSFEHRKRQVELRRSEAAKPQPPIAEIDAAHDRAMAGFAPPNPVRMPRVYPSK